MPAQHPRAGPWAWARADECGDTSPLLWEGGSILFFSSRWGFCPACPACPDLCHPAFCLVLWTLTRRSFRWRAQSARIASRQENRCGVALQARAVIRPATRQHPIFGVEGWLGCAVDVGGEGQNLVFPSLRCTLCNALVLFLALGFSHPTCRVADMGVGGEGKTDPSSTPTIDGQFGGTIPQSRGGCCWRALLLVRLQG